VAERLACDGKSVLAHARTFPDLNSAVADCALTIATTRRSRRIKLEAVTPRAAAEHLLALPPTAHCALVFGPEQSGLSNEEPVPGAIWSAPSPRPSSAA